MIVWSASDPTGTDISSSQVLVAVVIAKDYKGIMRKYEEFLAKRIWKLSSVRF